MSDPRPGALACPVCALPNGTPTPLFPASRPARNPAARPAEPRATDTPPAPARPTAPDRHPARTGQPDRPSRDPHAPGSPGRRLLGALHAPREPVSCGGFANARIPVGASPNGTPHPFPRLPNSLAPATPGRAKPATHSRQHRRLVALATLNRELRQGSDARSYRGCVTKRHTSPFSSPTAAMSRPAS